ncbi:MAG TPA: alginate export family protein [Bacteroidia bacterium]|nr:alginate export family protein [Bacteroidia bacterium]
MKPTRIAILAFPFLLAAALHAGDGSGKLILNDAVPALIKPTLDTRIRYEYGKEEGLDESNAGTMRNRVGLLTREIAGFQAFVEYEGTLAVDRDSYRAASVHGPATKTVIADPESHELNQAWVAYDSPSDVFKLKAGRQAIDLDNQRYLGSVAWRQNQQTMDAAAVTWRPDKDLEIYYGYLWQVNRIFGSDAFFAPHTDFKGQSHLFNAKYKGLPFGTLTTYVYSLDLHNEAGDANSNTSFGAILAGPLGGTGIAYYAELAYQIDSHENPNDYAAAYAHATLSKDLVKGLNATVGIERLGSDNGIGYQFPIGTNHKFNGFADRFLATPAGGLTDLYLTLGTPLPCGVKLATSYHYFEDDGFDTTLGQEIDLVASKDLGKGFSVLAKAARFWGQGGQPDTTRVSVELGYKY